MKRILLSISLLLLTFNGFAQKGFGIDGSIGLGYNGGDLVYPLLLEGRTQFNDHFSLNLGLGIWNSGFKGSWKQDGTDKATLYNLSSNKTLPSLQLGARFQVPVFSFEGKNVRFFAEPKLYFLPFSAQTVTLVEKYYDVETQDLTGNKIYTPTGEKEKSSFKSACQPRLFGGIQLGFTYAVDKNFDLAISYGYTKMDLFKDLRGLSMADKAQNSWTLDDYLPKKDLQIISVGFLVNFDLN